MQASQRQDWLLRFTFAGPFLLFYVWRLFLQERSLDSDGWRVLPDLLIAPFFLLW